MQREPLLLSSARIGVPQKNKKRVSVGTLLLLLAATFFVLVGAVDIVSRLFGMGGLLSAQADVETRAPLSSLSATTTTSHVSPFIPLRLRIPAGSIDASVEAVGVNARGEMQAPSTFRTVAWYRQSAQAGAGGNTVIAGHFNSPILGSGVFENLSQLHVGDRIVVEGEGVSLTYVVKEMTVYDADRAPLTEIFSTTGAHQLVLITCDGAWDAGIRRYDKRLILIADPL